MKTVMRQFAKVAMLFTISLSALAQDKRVEMGWTGENGYFERHVPSSEQPLSFYLSDQRRQEFLRAETDNCADPSACKGMKVKVTHEEVGSAFGRRIVQIVYTFAGQPEQEQTPEAYWKSIVIETRPDMYRELLLLKNEGGFWGGPPSMAKIVNAGTTKLLVTRDDTTSREMWCTGEFWVLGESGATVADFSQVEAAVRKMAPRGTQNVTPMCAAVDPGKLELRADIQRVNPECTACGVEGDAVVKFKFEGPRAVPVSAEFAPAAP